MWRWAIALLLSGLVASQLCAAEGALDLWRAITLRDLAQVERLIEAGAPINQVLSDDETALMLAARKRDAAIVDLLLRHGADVNAKNRQYKTALMSACEGGSQPVISMLLRAGADPNSRGFNRETAYLYAARYSTPAVLTQLEKSGADRGAKDDGRRGALFWSAYQSNEPVVRFLLAKGEDVNEAGMDGISPLLASKTDSMRRILLDAGADAKAKDKSGNSALMWGLIRAPGLGVDVARILIAKGVDVNAKGRQYSGSTPLSYASWFAGGDAQMVRLLLANGARVDPVDDEGRTPIMLVSSREIASILIAAGADLGRREKNGRTPLGEAIRSNRKEVAELLRLHGAKE